MTTPPTRAAGAGAERRRARRRRMTMLAGINAVLLAAVVTTSAIALTNAANPERGSRTTAATPSASSGPAPRVFPDDAPAAVAGAQPCTAVRVLSSFENAEMVQHLAEAYNAQPRDVAGACVTVSATKSKSGVAATDLERGFPTLAAGAKPTVWIPDSTNWLTAARTAGDAVHTTGTSAGSSDIVLAMPRPLAEASGWADKPPSWEDVFAGAENPAFWKDRGHPEWGSFKLGKTSPLVATSGAAAMYASFRESAGHLDALTVADVQKPEVTAEVKQHELATSHYMATPEHFLWHAREAEKKGSSADFLSAVIVDEKSVWDYNRGITSRDGITRVEAAPPEEPLVPVYPTDGLFAADNPVATLPGNASPAEQAAADDFVRFIGTSQGQAAVQSGGYRDGNGVLADEVQRTAGLHAAAGSTVAWPSADVVSAVSEAFPTVRKRANVLFLVDVSGSMDEPVQGGTKLTEAQRAITLALHHFTPGDRVGVAAFAQDAEGALVPGEVTPMADVGSSRDAMEADVASLQSWGDTPLYEAVDTFTRRLGESWDPKRINAVVLLSDGENDTSTETTSAEQMTQSLEHQHHGGKPVMVFTLAYGADADVKALQAIASSTGAHYYDATDPTKLEEVLGDLVTSF